jgi:hypothetical protein
LLRPAYRQSKIKPQTPPAKSTKLPGSGTVTPLMPPACTRVIAGPIVNVSLTREVEAKVAPVKTETVEVVPETSDSDP